MLSGANDLRAIFRWGRRLRPKGLAAFGIGHGRAPCHATYHYVVRSIAAADLERALRGSVPSGSARHVAIDGKRLRGSQSENSPGIHVLQAFSTGLQASIGALAVPPDSAEVVEAIALLKLRYSRRADESPLPPCQTRRGKHAVSAAGGL